MALPIGSKAPDFELTSQEGDTVRLSDVYRDNNVVLFFYPKDDTPGCTTEACSFRDQYDVFTDAGADVLGISGDATSSHRAFADKLNLNFRILSDKGNKARKAYKVKDTIPFLLPGRETFIIDREGTIRHHFASQIAAAKHVSEALRVVKELAASQRGQ